MTARIAARRITEAEWQDQVIDLAHIRGWLAVHFRPARTIDGWRTPVAADGAGWPDLILVRPRDGRGTERVERIADVWLDGACVGHLTARGIVPAGRLP